MVRRESTVQAENQQQAADQVSVKQKHRQPAFRGALDWRRLWKHERRGADPARDPRVWKTDFATRTLLTPSKR